MKVWKILLLLGACFALLMLKPAAAVSQIALSYDVVDNKIRSDEVATYTLHIQNNQEKADTIYLGSHVPWDVTIQPYIINIAAHGTARADVRIAAPINTNVGSYSVEIFARSRSAPAISTTELFLVNIIKNVGLVPVEGTIVIPNKVEPGAINLSITVKNNENYRLADVVATADSELFEEPYPISVGSISIRATKSVSIPVQLRTKTPGYYDITITLSQNDEVLGTAKKRVELLEKEAVAVTREVSKGILSQQHTITIKNTGNVLVKKEEVESFSVLEKYFVSASPAPTATKAVASREEWFWIYSLEPGDSIQIVYSVSYLSLAVILVILAVLGSLSYMYLYEEFEIKKELLFSSTKECERYIKIKLHVRNKTNKEVPNVAITDWVPTPLKIIKEFGTLEPQVIKKEKNAVKVIWRLDKFEPKEERVLSYGTRSTLEIVGSLILPRARVSYKSNEKIKRFYSKVLHLTGREAE